MKTGMSLRTFLGIAMAASSLAAAPVVANPVSEFAMVTGGGGASLPMLLQCVPYARIVSGIQIRGDAWTWWDQAKGRYARGNRPKVGAVMAFRPYGKMELGHVAAVSQIIDSRTVLLRHANWSPINGSRGQIEDDVEAVDVSPNNDWSQVRVWFAPIQGLGGTAWPVHGFIYNEKPRGSESVERETPGRGLINSGIKSGSGTKPAVRATDPYANDPIGAIIAQSLS